MSPVTYPAYNDTEASARTLDEAKQALKNSSEEQRQLAVAQEQAHRDRVLSTLLQY